MGDAAESLDNEQVKLFLTKTIQTEYAKRVLNSVREQNALSRLSNPNPVHKEEDDAVADEQASAAQVDHDNHIDAASDETVALAQSARVEAAVVSTPPTAQPIGKPLPDLRRTKSEPSVRPSIAAQLANAKPSPADSESAVTQS